MLAALDVSTNVEAMVRAAIILSMPHEGSSLLSKEASIRKLFDLRVLQASMLPKITVYTFGKSLLLSFLFLTSCRPD